MKTILLTNLYKSEPLKIVQSQVPEGFTIKFLTEQTERCLIEEIKEADYMLAGGRLRIGVEALDNAVKLRMIQRTGVGLDAIDLDVLREKNIPLYVNQGVNSQSVAEHTLLLILSCLRRLTEINANTHNGIWKKQEQGVCTHELRGKTVGIIGMGNIAQCLVNLLSGFGVTILYDNIFKMSDEFEKQYNMRFVSKDELFASSDIISINCALTDETKNLINRDTIAGMKDGVIIVNTARGQIVDSNAVAEGLSSGKIAFAGLDVHECEPISEDYPLKNVSNAILTPHIGGVTYESFFNMMHDAMRNIELFDKGKLQKIEQYRYL